MTLSEMIHIQIILFSLFALFLFLGKLVVNDLQNKTPKKRKDKNEPIL